MVRRTSEFRGARLVRPCRFLVKLIDSVLGNDRTSGSMPSGPGIRHTDMGSSRE
jgi:hypothetical protein